MEGSRLFNCKLEKILKRKFRDKFKDFMSQTLGVLISKLKAIKNTMKILLSYVSSVFPAQTPKLNPL